MDAPAAPVRLLVRLAGEMGTKSDATRRRFLRLLMRNVHLALRARQVPARVEQRWSRLFVETTEPARARAALARVFGVHEICDYLPLRAGTPEELAADCAPLFRDAVAGRTFAVRVTRTGTHPYSSHDCARAVGSALRPGARGVDLEHPEVQVRLRIADGEAYALGAGTPGPEGLPVGTGGRVLALFSGGFDSPVAAWRAARRGLEVELVHFDLGGCGQVEQTLAVADVLAQEWAPAFRPRLHVVDLAPLVEALVAGAESRLRQVLLRRAMYRAGERLAQELQAEALVTGESLAQVSTQTLRNLAVAQAAISLPVLQPLIAHEKNETIAQARLIGTHDASARVQEHCSIADTRVETKADPAQIDAAEALLAGGDASPAWIARAVAARRVLPLGRRRTLELPAHVVQAVPAGARVVDVREAAEGPSCGAPRLPLSGGYEPFDALPRDVRYVFVCTTGRRSSLVARRLREHGYEAWSLAGGVRALRPQDVPAPVAAEAGR